MQHTLFTSLWGRDTLDESSENYCIILAAGLSRRLGKDKALIEVGGRPLVSAMAQMMVGHGLKVCVVSSSEWDEEEVPLFGAVMCINHNPDTGRTGSIKYGLSALGWPKRVIIAPVDRPGFSSETLRRLVESDVCACPSNEGRGGHPILLDASAVESVRNALPDTPLRSLCDPLRFQVEDPHLSLNVDTEADVERLRSDWPEIESSWKVNTHPE